MRVHGEDRDRARGGRRDRHRGADRREHRAGRESRRASRSATSSSRSSTAPATRSSSSEIREAGARVRLITDGDVAGAIAAGRSSLGVDLLYGIGGTPEGITAACALKCLGGAIQGKLWPRNDEERSRAVEAGYDLDRVLATDDMVSGNDVFFAATGVTDGYLLDGVRTTRDGAITESLVMRSRSGTIRTIRSEHRWEKLEKIAQVDYHPKKG